jgi:hypothetical protein
VSIAIEVGQHETLAEVLDRTITDDADVLEFRRVRRAPSKTAEVPL